MKHNINFVLIYVIFFLLLSMVGMVLYFNYTYEGINENYESAVKNLKNLSNELNVTIYEVNVKNEELVRKEKMLIDIVNQLNLSNQKISSLGEFYAKEKGVRAELEENLDVVGRERDFWKLNYTQAKQDLELAKKNYQIKENELNTAKRRITTYESVLDSIDREVTHDNGADEWVTDIENKLKQIDETLDDYDSIIRDDVQGSEAARLLNNNHDDLADMIKEIKTKLAKLKTNIKDIKESLDHV